MATASENTTTAEFSKCARVFDLFILTNRSDADDPSRSHLQLASSALPQEPSLPMACSWQLAILSIISASLSPPLN